MRRNIARIASFELSDVSLVSGFRMPNNASIHVEHVIKSTRNAVIKLGVSVRLQGRYFTCVDWLVQM